MTKAEFNALYNLFEAVATAIDKCRLRKPQRERVNEAISNFRRAVITLPAKKKSPRENPREPIERNFLMKMKNQKMKTRKN